MNNRIELSHRVAYLLAVSDIPAGFVVSRRCGDALCCRPSHLGLAEQRLGVNGAAA